MIFARRPMILEELRCALAVEPELSYIEQEALPEGGNLLSVCGGLIVISEDRETIRFIHYTTQEYLQRSGYPDFSSAQAYLASICTTYLSFSTFASGPCLGPFQVLGPHRIGERLERNVLLEYASQYWGDHVRECHSQDPAIHAMVTSFLTRETNVSSSLEIRHHLGSQIDEPHSYDVSELYVVAAFGLEWMTEELLQQGANVDARDSRGRTPLHNASADGHLNIVKILLERGANIKAMDRDGFGAMQLAAEAGHEPATRFLLNEHVSLPDMKFTISRVAYNGHCGVLRLILDRLKDARNRAQCVESAIREASESENKASFRLLLDEVEDLDMYDSQSDLKNEALFQALISDNPLVVQLLLELGTDLNTATYDDDEKLLHRVARWGSVTAAEYLLDHGANIEAINTKGDRPIHVSLAGIQLKGMFRLLLRRSADVNVYGSNKEPPLITVSKQGKVKSVQLLLDRGADTLAKDKNFDRSAVEWAALHGHPPVVQLLLASQQQVEISEGLLALSYFYQALNSNIGIQVEGSDFGDSEVEASLMETSEVEDSELEDSDLGLSKVEISGFGDSLGGSGSDEDPCDLQSNKIEDKNQLLSKINNSQPDDLKKLLSLHLPASKGDETVVRTLLNMGADADAFCNKGVTAMHRAAKNGHISIVKLLLDHGANIDSQERNHTGSTPLHFAIHHANYNTVQLLIEKGANIEYDSASYGTPLMHAVITNQEAIVRLLLESGADPNTETIFGVRGNVLHGVYYYNDLSLIRLLVAKGANLEAKNANGETPLLLAVKKARLDMISLLLELGADPVTVEETTTPGRWAYGVDFDTAMQMVKDAKLRKAEVDQAKRSSRSINERQVSGTKRNFSMISG